MNSTNYDRALHEFQKVFDRSSSFAEMQEVMESRDMVLSRYGEIFNLENIQNMSEKDFRSFLYFENNRHWTSLYRHVNSLTADMEVLRNALATLLDSSQPLAKRFDQAIGQIRGLGKGLATAILLVSSPKEYGVWNNTSEGALRELGLWREFVRGRTKGQQYEKLNSLLLDLTKDLRIDLWTLDALMWGIVSEEKDETYQTVQPVQKVIKETYSFFDDVQHPVLKDRLFELSIAPLDTIIREAGVIFESSLRLKGNLDTNNVGVRLVDELLGSNGQLVFSSHEGEQQGVQFLFRGAMQFIRNPPMHKIIDYPESVARQYIRLIDSLLLLLDQATLKGPSSKASERKQWDEKTFFEEASKNCIPSIVETMKTLYGWANKIGSVGFGTGAVSGSFTLYLEKNGERSSVFSVYTEGTLTLYAQNIEKIFSAKEVEQFKISLAKIPELRGFKTYNRYSFSKKMENVFSNPEYLTQFMNYVSQFTQ